MLQTVLERCCRQRLLTQRTSAKTLLTSLMCTTTWLHNKYAPFVADAEATDESKTQRFRDNFLGTVMDNKSAKLAATGRLEAEHKTWIYLGCIAHALNLLIKDCANNRDGKNDDDERPAKSSKTDRQAKARKQSL
jgi:hypothetical protein